MVVSYDASQAREGSIVIDEKWHVNKQIPISLIGAILFQTAGALWWAAQVSSRLDAQDAKIAAIALIQDRVGQERILNLQRLSRAEQSLSDIRSFMDSIDNKLQKIIDKQGR